MCSDDKSEVIGSIDAGETDDGEEQGENSRGANLEWVSSRSDEKYGVGGGAEADDLVLVGMARDVIVDE